MAPTKTPTCPTCGGLLGELDQRRHALCEWARPEDWRALRPFMDGTLRGVDMASD